MINSLSWRQFGFYALVVLVLALLYGHTLSFELVYLDDNVWVNDYRWYLKSLPHAGLLFLRPDMVSDLFYRPLLNLTFLLNAFSAESSLAAYRLTNLFLHGVNGALVFHLLRKLGHSWRAAGTGGMIFLVHPVLTQAVVWIPGRTDSLLAFWIFAAFWLFLHYLVTGRQRWCYLHGLFFWGALASKETAVVLPVVLGCYLAMNRFSDGRRTKLMFLVSVWTGALLMWIGLRSLALPDGSGVGLSGAAMSVYDNLPALVSYWGKIFIPVNLSVLPVLEDLSPVYGWISAVVMSGLLLVSRDVNRERVLLGLMWFVCFILPALVLSFLKHEYRLYLPLFGAVLVILETNVVQSLLHTRRGMMILIALITLLGMITRLYTREYHDRYAFWHNAVRNSPHSPLAHRNLGAVYFLDDKFDKAEELFRAARRLNPVEVMVHNNLGLIAMQKGDFEQAEALLKEEIRINPGYANARFNLGLVHYRAGDHDAALRAWKETLRLDARYLQAYQNIAVVLYHRGRSSEAADYIRRMHHLGAPVPEAYRFLLE